MGLHGMKKSIKLKKLLLGNGKDRQWFYGSTIMKDPQVLASLIYGLSAGNYPFGLL
jgi:hypothetical protein